MCRLDFCQKFCCVILVPIPRDILGVAATLSLRLATICTLADFGFSIGTWTIFLLYTVFRILRDLHQSFQARKEKAHLETEAHATDSKLEEMKALEPTVPTHVVFDSSSLCMIKSKVGFARGPQTRHQSVEFAAPPSMDHEALGLLEIAP